MNDHKNHPKFSKFVIKSGIVMKPVNIDTDTKSNRCTFLQKTNVIKLRKIAINKKLLFNKLEDSLRAEYPLLTPYNTVSKYCLSKNS